MLGKETITESGEEDAVEISILLKITALGMVVTLLTKVLKASGREDHAFLVGLCGLMIVILWVLPYLVDFFATVEALMEL